MAGGHVRWQVLASAHAGAGCLSSASAQLAAPPCVSMCMDSGDSSSTQLSTPRTASATPANTHRHSQLPAANCCLTGRGRTCGKHRPHTCRCRTAQLGPATAAEGRAGHLCTRNPTLPASDSYMPLLISHSKAHPPACTRSRGTAAEWRRRACGTAPAAG